MVGSITVCTHQVTDKPAEAIDEHRLAPWERGASLAEGSLHDGLRLRASMLIDQTRRPGAAAGLAPYGPRRPSTCTCKHACMAALWAPEQRHAGE